MTVIETTSLGKRYGRFWALRDCTFAIPEGHLAALVGPNGAGKTTLLHLSVPAPALPATAGHGERQWPRPVRLDAGLLVHRARRPAGQPVHSRPDLPRPRPA